MPSPTITTEPWAFNTAISRSFPFGSKCARTAKLSLPAMARHMRSLSLVSITETTDPPSLPWSLRGNI